MPNTTRLLELALKGLQAERAKINDEIVQIKSQLDHGGKVGGVAQVKTSMTASPSARKRRRMSAEQKRKISETMKKRYAAINQTATKTASQVTRAESVGLKQSSGKRQLGGSRLTAAGRKRLSDLMKERWAERRKGKAK